MAAHERADLTRAPCDASGVVRAPDVSAALARVATGDHRTPHDVLGPHRTDGGWVVRVWRPGARECSLRTVAGDRVRMTRVHEAGIFAVELASDPGAYRVEVSYPGGWTSTAEDPYRFWPTLGDVDLHLFGEGNHHRLWEALGAHARRHEGVDGTAFAVWAPSARSVRVVGDFNSWDGRVHPMRMLGSSGVWELFVPGAAAGQHYKFEVNGATGQLALKADPMARAAELPPGTASIVAESRHEWEDREWLEHRQRDDPVNRPLMIYEVHVGSWRQGLSYRELAPLLADHVVDLGFMHGAAPRRRASLRWVVGISGVELLRADGAVRHARRLPLVRRSPPPARHRRDRRLGARALPA
jgi:1,4-alpha-glucan branching enzyme